MGVTESVDNPLQAEGVHGHVPAFGFFDEGLVDHGWHPDGDRFGVAWLWISLVGFEIGEHLLDGSVLVAFLERLEFGIIGEEFMESPIRSENLSEEADPIGFLFEELLSGFQEDSASFVEITFHDPPFLFGSSHIGSLALPRWGCHRCIDL